MKPNLNRLFLRLMFAAFASSFAGATQASAAAADCSPAPPEAALIAKGAQSWERRCTGCHSLDKNRIGPRHRDVFGREAGAVEDFKYSRALQSLNVVWTEETLDPWLANPTAFAPGTSMGFRLAQAEERTAIIAWLKSVSPAGGSCEP